MARRNLVDIDAKIIKAIITIGAKEGAKNVTAEKVAKLCGISHFTCFKHFGTKLGMLKAAAASFDRQYMDFMASLIKQGDSLRVVFTNMIEEFVKNSEGSLFYMSFISDYGFDPTEKNERSQEFLKYAKLFFKDEKMSDRDYLLYWDYITSMGFYYAEKIIHGYLSNNIDTLNIVCKICLEKL